MLAGFVPEGEFDSIPKSELVIDDAKIVFDDMLGGSDSICNFAVLEPLSDEFDETLLPLAGYRICVTLVSEHSCLRYKKVASLCRRLLVPHAEKPPSPGMGSRDLGMGQGFSFALGWMHSTVDASVQNSLHCCKFLRPSCRCEPKPISSESGCDGNRITGRVQDDKTTVMGFLERGGSVRTEIVRDRQQSTLQPVVRKHVQSGSALYSDELGGYKGLHGEYEHKVIDHAVKYVDGRVHTNGLENFWSLLKRGISGTYVSVEPFHLFRYLDEQAYRFNNRKKPMDDSSRFYDLLLRVAGRRVTYAALTGKVDARPF